MRNLIAHSHTYFLSPIQDLATTKLGKIIANNEAIPAKTFNIPIL